MSAHDYYSGRLVAARDRKSWWNPFSWWPDDPEDSTPPPSGPQEDAEEFWSDPVVQEIVGEIQEINRQLEEATGPENANLRRRLRKERESHLTRIQNLETFWMKERSRDGRSAA